MIFGYARVSTHDQNLDFQLDGLRKAGCERIFQEKVSSAKARPELNKLLEFTREGDTIIVEKLDRLVVRLGSIQYKKIFKSTFQRSFA